MTKTIARFRNAAKQAPVILALLTTFLAATPAPASVALKRNLYNIEITGGSGPSAWRLVYGTYIAVFYGAALDVSGFRVSAELMETGGDRAYFGHGPWLRQIDTRSGVVTRRWRFPWSISKLTVAGGKLLVEISQAEDLVHIYSQTITIDPDGDPQSQPIPNWPSSESTPAAEVEATSQWGLVLERGVPAQRAAELLPQVEEMVRRDPHTPWFRVTQGILLQATGDPRFASVIREAAAMPEANYTELLPISALLSRLKDPDLAQEVFEKGYRDFLDRGFDPRLMSSVWVRQRLYMPPVDRYVGPQLVRDLPGIERTYRVGPYARDSSLAWDELARQLRKQGQADQAKVWEARAGDPRSFDAQFPSGQFSLIWALCDGLAFVFLPGTVVLYILILFFRYRPQRKQDMAARTSWYNRPGLTLLRCEYAGRRERAAVLAIILVGTTCMGLMANLERGVRRASNAPSTLWGGSLAGPANIGYLESKTLAGKERNLLLAVACQQSGDDEKAERLYRELPGFAESWNNLGVLLKKNGKDSEARSAFEEAARLDPELPEAQLNLRGSATDYWTRQYARLFPGRPMLAVPTGDHFLKTFYRGSFSQMCLRALAGPLLMNQEEARLSLFGTNEGIDLRQGMSIWLVAALAWLLVLPQLRVTAPDGKLAVIGEALLPGSSRVFLKLGGLLGGLLMACAAVVAVLATVAPWLADRNYNWAVYRYGIDVLGHPERMIVPVAACVLLFGGNFVWVVHSWRKQRGVPPQA
jgi:tetratricopeptide (TPR) repeat protein